MKTKTKKKKRIAEAIKKIIKPKVAKITKKKIIAPKQAKQKIVTLGKIAVSPEKSNGVKITPRELQDGFHYDVSDQEYFALPYANASSVKVLCLGETPAHYNAILNGDDNDSDSKAFGRLVHSALLTPDVLKNVEKLPDNIKRRAGKEWEKLQQAYPGVTFLPPSEWKDFIANRDIAYRVRDSILNDPVAGNFFDNVRHEVVVIWTDKETGVRCKGKIDILGNGASHIVDIKTTHKKIPYRILKSGYYYGYHVQVAMYTDAVCTITEQSFDEPPPFWFIFVESAPPYLTLVANGHSAYDERIDNTDPYGYLKYGREDYKSALRTIADCMTRNEWEGYPFGPHDMVIPKWAGFEGVYV